MPGIGNARPRQRAEQQPSSAKAHLALGAMLHAQGNLAGAEANFRRALLLDPDDPVVMAKLAEALEAQGRAAEAVSVLRRAAQLNPADATVHAGLGRAYQAVGRPDDAVRSYLQALRLMPGWAQAHYDLGMIWQQQGRCEEAVAHYQQAVRLCPGWGQAHANLGSVLQDLGQFSAAQWHYEEALRLNPDDAQAHVNLGTVLLAAGDFQRGWAEYEWRWRLPSFYRTRTEPLWDGRPLREDWLLLYTEQGLGDTLQFVRYVPMAAARGARVILRCQPALKSLLQSCAGVSRVVAVGERLPPFSVHAALMSLPHLLGTTLSTIPATVPYVRADEARVAHWAGRLPDTASYRVGLAWAGAPANSKDRRRSMSLATLAPLAQVPGISFVSLQQGEAAAQTASPPPGMSLALLGPLFGDFADTAAVMSQLDLVISVDTAVAHLAGALGKPVWLLLSHVPDWRWLLNREDSPWYPTARLFRQRRPGDWEEVVARAATALREMTATSPLRA